PNGFDAGDLYPWPPYFSMGEALTSYLQAVGIRTKIRTMERAAMTAAWREKKLKNVIVGITGAAGDAATRLEAYVATGGGDHRGGPAGGRGPLPAPGPRAGSEEARGAALPDPAGPPRPGDPGAAIRAGVHLGHRPARRGARHQPDQGLRVLGAARGPAGQ